MVFQNYALYPNMTVEENMSFGLKMSTDMSDEEIEETVTSSAEMMDIGERWTTSQANSPVDNNSASHSAVPSSGDPNVFLMDEPLSNLDAKLRAGMRTEINRLQNDLDVTTLYVTHDQTEAMTMGDRLVVLNYGELHQIGTPWVFLYRPANRFVAGFLRSPSMNFFEGRLGRQHAPARTASTTTSHGDADGCRQPQRTRPRRPAGGHGDPRPRQRRSRVRGGRRRGRTDGEHLVRLPSGAGPGSRGYVHRRDRRPAPHHRGRARLRGDSRPGRSPVRHRVRRDHPPAQSRQGKQKSRSKRACRPPIA